MLQQDVNVRNQGDTDPVKQAPPAKDDVRRVKLRLGLVRKVRLQLFDRQQGDS